MGVFSSVEMYIWCHLVRDQLTHNYNSHLSWAEVQCTISDVDECLHSRVRRSVILLHCHFLLKCRPVCAQFETLQDMCAFWTTFRRTVTVRQNCWPLHSHTNSSNDIIYPLFTIHRVLKIVTRVHHRNFFHIRQIRLGIHNPVARQRPSHHMVHSRRQQYKCQSSTEKQMTEK